MALPSTGLLPSTSLLPGGAPTLLGSIIVEVMFDGTNWTDVSAYGRNGQIQRGSSRYDGPILRYEASTASVLLDNNDARFDPTYLSGPYVWGNGSQVMPGKAWRIRSTYGVGYTLWTGYADSWRLSYNLTGTDAVCLLTGTGVSKRIGQSALALAEPATLLSGTLVSDVLSPATGAIDAGVATVVGGTIEEDDAWAFLQLVADSELGELYERGDGTIVFRQRDAIFRDARSNTPQATFGDSGSDLRYRDITVSNDDVQIRNHIAVTCVGGVEQIATDSNSASAFGDRALSQSGLLLTSDDDALNYAQYVLSILSGTQVVGGVLTIAGDVRVESLVIDPRYDPAGLAPQVLGRELGDLITVNLWPPGRAFAMSRNCLIRGIQHTFGPGSWETVWSLQDTVRLNFLVFDHATLGTLDANKLG